VLTHRVVLPLPLQNSGAPLLSRRPHS